MEFEKNYPLDQFPDDFDMGKVGSSTDCTGLIPSALQNEAELESYESLYHFKAEGTNEKVEPPGQF